MPSQKNLTGFCVLVTRPRPEGERLCEQIRAEGGNAICFPTLEIRRLRSIPSLEKYGWAIFVSPRAVQRISLPPHLKIAAVGGTTAQTLKEAGIPVHCYPDKIWSTEGLLERPEFQNVKEAKIALIKGKEGRKTLEKVLRERGAKVDCIEVYERVLPKTDVIPYLDLLRKNLIHAIICTSVEGIENLKKLLIKNWDELQKIHLIVISERMKEKAIQLGFQHVVAAENATHESIIKTLIQQRKNDDTFN